MKKLLIALAAMSSMSIAFASTTLNVAGGQATCVTKSGGGYTIKPTDSRFVIAKKCKVIKTGKDDGVQMEEVDANDGKNTTIKLTFSGGQVNSATEGW